eukprot:scaffold86884_cov77-Phaeocystis_antarctica.AAC.1
MAGRPRLGIAHVEELEVHPRRVICRLPHEGAASGRVDPPEQVGGARADGRCVVWPKAVEHEEPTRLGLTVASRHSAVMDLEHAAFVTHRARGEHAALMRGHLLSPKSCRVCAMDTPTIHCAA